MRLLFVIPTTGGPLVVTALRPRAGLPVSAAFVEGDFRGLPWSGDYARLCAPGGPLSRVIPQLAPHELRLSASFDAGRSWEAPIALAHLLLAQGHACAARPAEAEAIVWTTGAIDLDLAPIAGDYALADKIERTAALLDEVPATAPIFAVLPPASEVEEAWTGFQAIAKARPLIRVAAASMVEVAAALVKQLTPGAVASGTAARSTTAAPDAGQKVLRRPWWPATTAAGAVLVLAGGLGTYALNVTAFQPQNPPEPTLQRRPVEANRSKPAPSSRVAVSEIRAAPGSDCRKVLFVPSAAVRQAVPALDDTTFSPSRLEDTLCGIAIKPAAVADRLTVEGDLPAAALAPTVGSDGATTYVLRANRQQNIVYQIQVSSETESGQRTAVIHHAIVR
jgi:hypothetical protein